MQLVDACRRVCDEPVALAAIDLALWDRAGRRAGRPVAALLTDAPAADVAVNATLSATDRAGAAAQAADAVAQGYECVKVKVGLGDDAGRLAAVRAAAGPARRAARRRQRCVGRRAGGARDRRARARRPGAGRGADARPGGRARRARAGRGARRDRRDGGRARGARRRRRGRGLLEDLTLRRHRRAAGRRDARAGLRRRGLPRLDARRAAGDRRRRARRRGARLARAAAGLRAGDAGTVRGRRRPAARASAGGSRCRAAAGWGSSRRCSGALGSAESPGLAPVTTACERSRAWYDHAF